jgi:hypothetical protein
MCLGLTNIYRSCLANLPASNPSKNPYQWMYLLSLNWRENFTSYNSFLMYTIDKKILMLFMCELFFEDSFSFGWYHNHLFLACCVIHTKTYLTLAYFVIHIVIIHEMHFGLKSEHACWICNHRCSHFPIPYHQFLESEIFDIFKK